ncbi:MAG: TonB family protein [Prevotella sp.]|jgi:protein TonB|nr:TonB family protein [Prevotella sp.]
MEIKKSSRADLDGHRVRDFLLGIVLVVAALYVVMEYDIAVTDDEFDAEMLENIVKELDLQALKEEERIPLIKEAVRERPQSADKLNIVDDTETELKDELPPPEQDVELKTVDEADDPDQPTVVDMEQNPLNFRVVEELPEFPGGASEFMKWLTRNLKYPKSAQQRGVQGKVVAQFIVNKDGSISNIEILKPVEPSLDREALRVLGMMPQWKPGQQDQKPCRTQVCIPIVFKL